MSRRLTLTQFTLPGSLESPGPPVILIIMRLSAGGGAGFIDATSNAGVAACWPNAPSEVKTIRLAPITVRFILLSLHVTTSSLQLFRRALRICAFGGKTQAAKRRRNRLRHQQSTNFSPKVGQAFSLPDFCHG